MVTFIVVAILAIAFGFGTVSFFKRNFIGGKKTFQNYLILLIFATITILLVLEAIQYASAIF